MDGYLAVWKKYADFNGRANRREFWTFVLINIVIGMVLVGATGDAANDQPGLLAMLFYLAALLPTIAVSARRLHDTNRSGWWILIGLIPFLGALVLIVFYLLDGTPGPNKYGPDPKGRVSAAAA